MEAAGHMPVIVDYLTAGWTAPQLAALFATAALTPRSALPRTHDLAETRDLLCDDADENAILGAMPVHPVLVDRPLVAPPRGMPLCRPAQAVDDLL